MMELGTFTSIVYVDGDAPSDAVRTAIRYHGHSDYAADGTNLDLPGNLFQAWLQVAQSPQLQDWQIVGDVYAGLTEDEDLLVDEDESDEAYD
jgi:hypothetical protein